MNVIGAVYPPCARAARPARDTIDQPVDEPIVAEPAASPGFEVLVAETNTRMAAACEFVALIVLVNPMPEASRLIGQMGSLLAPIP